MDGELLKVVSGFGVLWVAITVIAYKWIDARIKKSITHEYEEKSKAIDFAYSEKLKSLEHGFNEQLEKLRVQLQNESLTTNRKFAAELEHDRKLFEKITSLVDETTFRDVCSGIGNYQFYDYGEYNKVRYLEDYGNKVENHFLNEQLQNEFATLCKELDAFTTTVARVFFATSENRYMLYPELKNFPEESRERRTYWMAYNETRDASHRVLSAYDSFRHKIKTVLYL